MNLENELEKGIPQELVEKLFEHYEKIRNNFRTGKHETAELNGSKFSETVYRILQNKLTGNYTPLDRQIRNFTDGCRHFETLPSSGVDDTLRIHIPRTLILIVDIRNKRGVGHVSGMHDPNDLDSLLIKSNVDWIMAELVRVFAGITKDEAQSAIENIIKIELPIIEKVEDIRRILDTTLRYWQQVLLLLLGEYPAFVKINDLFEWTEHSNIHVFIKILEKMHKGRFIEKRTNDCKLLRPGILEAEKIINKKKK